MRVRRGSRRVADRPSRQLVAQRVDQRGGERDRAAAAGQRWHAVALGGRGALRGRFQPVTGRDRSAARATSQGPVARPAISRWASVRLPSCPRFCKPPCDPGRRVFPGPVLTLAALDAPSRSWTGSSAGSHTPVRSLVCPSTRPPLRGPARSRLSVREPPRGRQVPRAPLLRAGVTAAKKA